MKDLPYIQPCNVMVKRKPPSEEGGSCIKNYEVNYSSYSDTSI